MLFNKQTSKAKSTEQINHHFFFVEVPVELVGPEAAVWGEGTWWPQKSLTNFERISEGELGVGTRFKIKITKPMTPPMVVEVTKFVPNRFLEFTFKSGIFKGGQEVITIGERANGTRVDYELHYRVRGILNQILWSLLSHKQYEANITLVMDALREHVLRLYREKQEKQLEGA